MADEAHPHIWEYDSTELASILADPRQRLGLAILLDGSHPMTKRDLAVALAAEEEDSTPADASKAAVRRSLIHVNHLIVPKLTATGWVELHPEGIVPTDRLSTTERGRWSALLRSYDLEWEVLSTVLERPRYRRIVSILEERSRPIAIDALARELLTEDRNVQTADERTLAVTLHHADLPRLDALGVLEYDRDEQTVTPLDRRIFERILQ